MNDQALAAYTPTNALCGNVFLQRDGFGISYNPRPGIGLSMFAGDDDSDETAIVADGKYYILNGDFRCEYAELSAQGLDACLRFFASKPDLVSSWSASVDAALARLAGEPA